MHWVSSYTHLIGDGQFSAATARILSVHHLVYRHVAPASTAITNGAGSVHGAYIILLLVAGIVAGMSLIVAAFVQGMRRDTRTRASDAEVITAPRAQWSARLYR